MPYQATVTGRAILITVNKSKTLIHMDLLGVVKSGTPASKARVFIAFEAYHLTDHNIVTNMPEKTVLMHIRVQLFKTQDVFSQRVMKI